VIDAFGLPVSDNVIHGTVEAGIRVKSTDVTIERNLVSFTQARACYQDRVEEMNFDHHGSIEVINFISLFIYIYYLIFFYLMFVESSIQMMHF